MLPYVMYTSVLFILSFINTSMDPIDYVTAFYVTMVVGAILMITTCILAIVVVCFTVECFKKSKRVPYNNSLKGEYNWVETPVFSLATVGFPPTLV